MTGYGAASSSQNNITTNIEIRTLNSKFLDLNLRLSKTFSDKELEIRRMISDELKRGKVTINIEHINEQEVELKQHINKPLFTKYYNELSNLAHSVGSSNEELFKLALSSPDVIVNAQGDEMADSEWQGIKELLQSALKKCNDFRSKEGGELKKKFESYISEIGEHLKEVEILDPIRIEKIRTRIKSNLKKFIEEEEFDQNRLEQEIVYYIEKLDITEEKVRLSNHLEHFKEVLNSGSGQGKKLGFISQEIGREINTIGSKANDAHIQRHVVIMKEELEKIKEQLLNVL